VASEVFICNLALSNVSKPDITSLNEASAEARACKRYFSHVRDVMLESYPWLFARKIAALAEVTNDRPKLWAHAYRKPADCLKILLLHDECMLPLVFSDGDVLRRGGTRYDTAATTIYTNASPAYLEYTYRLDDPTKFSASFVEAFGWELAVRIAMPLTRDPKIRADAFQIASKMTSDAAVHDANQVRETTDVPVASLEVRQ
jgi:hypothetical protein